ncbi:MAG: ArsC family transcriptional regulator [Bacillota bacterium]
MNLQIYGKAKCFGTRSAERFFKERKIKYQLIDTTIKGMSAGELDSVIKAVGDIELLMDTKSPLYSSLNIGLMRNTETKKKALLENPKLLATPIVRDCVSRRATVGDCTAVWKEWLK